jgi:hypothetical protein
MFTAGFLPSRQRKVLYAIPGWGIFLRMDGPTVVRLPAEAACVDAVQQAVATNEMQQAAAAAWMTASEPEVPAAYPVGGSPDSL